MAISRKGFAILFRRNVLPTCLITRELRMITVENMQKHTFLKKKIYLIARISYT